MLILTTLTSFLILQIDASPYYTFVAKNNFADYDYEKGRSIGENNMFLKTYGRQRNPFLNINSIPDVNKRMTLSSNSVHLNKKINRKNKNIKPNRKSSKPNINEFQWNRCSSKFVNVARYTDSYIFCEANAPIGTSFEWIVPSDNINNEDRFLNALSPSPMNDPDMNLIKQNSNENKMLFRSRWDFDCPTEGDEGIYMIFATTPSGKTYNRTFQVQLVDSIFDIRKGCRDSYMSRTINIADQIKYAQATENSTIIFRPPRYTAPPPHWKYSYYWVTPLDGDKRLTFENDIIKIQDVKKEDAGCYQCYVFDDHSYEVMAFKVEIITDHSIIRKPGPCR